jgi:hypothetical protein
MIHTSLIEKTMKAKLAVVPLAFLLNLTAFADRFDLPTKTEDGKHAPESEKTAPSPAKPPAAPPKPTPAVPPSPGKPAAGNDKKPASNTPDASTSKGAGEGVTSTPIDRISEGAKVSELGLMRIYVVMDEGATGQEDVIHQELSQADFRVFPAKNFAVATRLDPDSLYEEGGKHKADLVCLVKAATEEKAAMGDFKIYQSTVTSQLYSPVSGELLATDTATLKGPRKADAEEARKGAVQAGIKQAIAGMLQKAATRTQRLLVHEVQLTGVKTETQLAEIRKRAEALDGATHVRLLSFEAKTGLAVLEITAAPKTAETWRAFVSGLPDMKTPPEKVNVTTNDLLRKKHADWFAE